MFITATYAHYGKAKCHAFQAVTLQTHMVVSETCFCITKNDLRLFCSDREHELEGKTVSKDLEICGFVDIKDIANPPHISRHLVLPLPTSSSPVKSEAHGAGRYFHLLFIANGDNCGYFGYLFALICS